MDPDKDQRIKLRWLDNGSMSGYGKVDQLDLVVRSRSDLLEEWSVSDEGLLVVAKAGKTDGDLRRNPTVVMELGLPEQEVLALLKTFTYDKLPLSDEGLLIAVRSGKTQDDIVSMGPSSVIELVLGDEDSLAVLKKHQEAQSAQLIQDSWKFRRAKKERNAAATKYAKPLRNPAAACDLRVDFDRSRVILNPGFKRTGAGTNHVWSRSGWSRRSLRSWLLRRRRGRCSTRRRSCCIRLSRGAFFMRTRRNGTPRPRSKPASFAFRDLWLVMFGGF
jgi:hypothetical protein